MPSSTALSNRIYARIEAKFGKLPKPARAAFKKFTDALAEGLLEFLDEDATIQVTVSTTVSQGGLQTQTVSSATGPVGTVPTTSTAPTGAPLQPVTLTGTGTGRFS